MRLLVKIYLGFLLLIGAGIYIFDIHEPKWPDERPHEVRVTGKNSNDVYRFEFPANLLDFHAHSVEDIPVTMKLRLRENQILSERLVRKEQEHERIPAVDQVEDILRNFVEVRILVGSDYGAHNKLQRVFPDPLRGQVELEQKFGLLSLGLVKSERKDVVPKGRLTGRYWQIQGGQIVEKTAPQSEFYVLPENIDPKGFHIKCILKVIAPRGRCVLDKDITKNLRIEIAFHSKSLPRWKEFDQRMTQFVMDHLVGVEPKLEKSE